MNGGGGNNRTIKRKGREGIRNGEERRRKGRR